MEPDDKVMDSQVEEGGYRFPREGGRQSPPPVFVSVEQVQVALQLLGMKLPEGSLVQSRALEVVLDFLRR